MDSIYKNFIKFILVGFVAFTSDITLYLALVSYGWQTILAKATGFIFGLIIGYFLNSIFTFQKTAINQKRFFKYLFVYFCSLIANTLTNEYLINLFINSINRDQAFLIAVIIATTVSLLMNFFGLRYYVFKN